MDYIYALCDPRDDRVRYIGKTDNPDRRYKAHLIEKSRTYRTNWIKSLAALGLKPKLKIIEIVSFQSTTEWEARERYWIAYYRNIYSDLTNGSDGGDCGPDCTGKHLIKSEIGRKNIIAALIKRNKSPEMREVSRKNGLSHKGKRVSPETIEKIRIANTGKKMHSEEFKRELAERNKIRKYNSEQMRQNARKLWDDPVKGPEMRRRISERNKTGRWSKGKKGDPQKARAASRKLWDDPIKAADARAKLIERNKHNKWHNK